MGLRETAIAAFTQAQRSREEEAERLERERYEDNRKHLFLKIEKILGVVPTEDAPFTTIRALYLNCIQPVVETEGIFFTLHEGRLTCPKDCKSLVNGIPAFENTSTTINGMEDLGRILSSLKEVL